MNATMLIISLLFIFTSCQVSPKVQEDIQVIEHDIVESIDQNIDPVISK